MAALVGLVVSLVVVWARLAPDTPAQESESGPPASVAGSSVEPSSAGDPARIGRSDAAVEAAETSDEARPVRVVLSSVGIDAPVRPVGVAEDGQMQLPPDPRVMGWYRFGPAPGADGSVVVAGHLDSKRFGLGPLARLRDVEVGQPIEVTLAGGATSTYTVVAVERFDRQGLPEELFSRQGPERLRVITCGGEYDPDAGGYQQNLVVTAAPA